VGGRDTPVTGIAREDRGPAIVVTLDTGTNQEPWRSPDALIAATARAHGAVLLARNVDDFPMHDLRVEIPEATNS
jgi:predicted nucleic acid-binding protein